MNITFHILVTLTSRVTILKLRVFIPSLILLRVLQHCFEVGVCFVRFNIVEISSLFINICYLPGSREVMGLLFLFIESEF